MPCKGGERKWRERERERERERDFCPYRYVSDQRYLVALGVLLGVDVRMAEGG